MIDGTGKEGSEADILIRGNEIVFVGKVDEVKIKVGKKIDAKGKVVSPGFIDTHAHLYADEFKDDIEEVIERATANGVNKILLPNIDSGNIESMHNLVNKYPNILVPMMGLHPCSVAENYKEELNIAFE